MANINFTAIKSLWQDELKTFADTVFTNMNQVELYAPFQAEVTKIAPLALAYQHALIEAKKGGSDRVAVKNEAKTQLIDSLKTLVKTVDTLWTTPAYDEAKHLAGFELCKPPVRHNLTYVDPPKNLVLVNDDRTGVVNFSWQKVEFALTYALEELQEDGSWKNGRYSQQHKLQLSDMPVGKLLTLRLKTIGPDTLVSVASEPASVYVA